MLLQHLVQLYLGPLWLQGRLLLLLAVLLQHLALCQMQRCRWLGQSERSAVVQLRRLEQLEVLLLRLAAFLTV